MTEEVPEHTALLPVWCCQLCRLLTAQHLPGLHLTLQMDHMGNCRPVLTDHRKCLVYSQLEPMFLVKVNELIHLTLAPAPLLLLLCLLLAVTLQWEGEVLEQFGGNTLHAASNLRALLDLSSQVSRTTF